VLLVLLPAEHRQKSRPIRTLQRCRSMANVGAEHLPKIGRTRSELHFLNAAAQTRVLSVARIRLDFPPICATLQKDILRNDVSKFESYMASQPVQSLRCYFPVCENRRHSRGLGYRARVSGRQFLESRSWIDDFAALVSARHFPISVSACRRPVRCETETGLSV
jgi:hypothetical protein